VTKTPPSKNKRKTPLPRSAGEVTRDRQSERPTVNPPFDVQAFARAAAGPAEPIEPGSSDAVDPGERSERITITNEVELEIARAKSAQNSEPPQPRTSALLIADALVSSSPPPRSITPTNIESAVLGALASSPAPEITERTIEDPASEMRERFSLGDYSGALEMAELILAGDPSNLEAAECGENCRSTLLQMYAAKIGSLDRIPTVLVPRTQMRWLSIDHRAGFILSLIDGTSTIEMVLDVAGMPRLDSLRILHELAQRRIVAFR